MKVHRLLTQILFLLVLSLSIQVSYCQVINVGNGSYTTTFPGVDAAGRNSFPSGTPFTVGEAANQPTPTNDWWSHKVKNPHSDNLFNYPFTLKTVNSGLEEKVSGLRVDELSSMQSMYFFLENGILHYVLNTSK